MNLPLDAQARIENAQRLMSGALGTVIVSLASLTGEPAPRVRSPKWMSYLVWVGVALLLGSLAMWLAEN